MKNEWIGVMINETVLVPNAVMKWNSSRSNAITVIRQMIKSIIYLCFFVYYILEVE